MRLRYSRSIRCPDEVALLSFYSSSVPSGRIPALFFQFYLFISGWGLSRILRSRVFIRKVVCAVRGHSVIVVQPVCTSAVRHHFLTGAFSLRVCMQGSRSLSGWPIPSFLLPRLSLLRDQCRFWSRLGLRPRSGASDPCLRWWVGSFCSPPVSSGAFVGFRSSTVGETPVAWSCDTICGTTSIRLSTVSCRLWAPLAATWAHVLGSNLMLPYLLHAFWGMPDLYVHRHHTCNM